MVLSCRNAWSDSPTPESSNSNTNTIANASIQVIPAEVRLSGQLDRVQLQLTLADTDVIERQTDLTADATYRSEDPSVVAVNDRGMTIAQSSGRTEIVVEVAGQTLRVPVIVEDAESCRVEFFRDIRPLVAKAGCAAGACHAAQHGKGGFKQSAFGFDPQGDYNEMVKAGRGRRVNFASPELSLLLRKPSMAQSHEGGLRLPAGSVEYQLMSNWIASGAPLVSEDKAVKVSSLSVTPKLRVGELGLKQQLRVTAVYADATQRDVTASAIYDSIDPSVATVDETGHVQAVGYGQTAVMVRFDGQVVVSTFVIPYSDQSELKDWKSNNFVDEFAAKKFKDLGLQPSPLCDDATFIRRAFLDCIGTLPDPDTVLQFVDSSNPDKRAELVDRLLGLTGDTSVDIYGDQYAAHWTLRWSDLIRNSSKSLGEQGMWALHNWIKDAFRRNQPYDDFVSELITAQGSIYSSGPANYFRVNANSSDLAEATSQLFMGVRLECAKCHQHPFEKYGQADYYSMAAFFSRVGFKNSEEFGLFGRETVVVVRDTGDVTHPQTKKKLDPTPLEGEPTDHPLDRRLPLADWLTDRENPFFARSVVNRYMRYLLGSGLVEPVDDMRSTNPASNVELLDALADDFVQHDFDLKHLIRTIMTSRLYGLSSEPTAENRSDQRFYSHYLVKRLSAEPLLDAIDHATGVKTKFPNLPLGTRAIDLPDAEYNDYFLNTFAKPRRTSVCECERSPDANLAQALHTLNGDTLAKKIADKNGFVTQQIAAKLDHDDLIRRLYLNSLCRLPTQAELDYSRQLLAESASPQEAYEDLMWALINSKQFLFVR
ncbi:MAG TPA: S-layer related protein (Precursor) [Planctomycetaceae bacterium]|nr:S-layer related protein (Precursor) [Planctomycetaceae bacterium]